jgi:hypothetical protein
MTPLSSSQVRPVWKQKRYALRYPDRFAARIAVNEAVKLGRLPNAKDLLCADCLTDAREYDHHLGYGLDHWLDVQPVCRSCHLEREKRRRPLCHRGHKYTERDWVLVNGRRVRRCWTCEDLRKANPDLEKVDGRGRKRKFAV